jgi:hypothetical protein
MAKHELPPKDADVIFLPQADAGCVSACNFDPLSWGIGVQN